ncbi:corrinoid protein [Lachnospiraceae bacterium ZAX-1]
MVDLQKISTYLQAGKSKLVKQLVQTAIEEGIDLKKILEEGLLAGMMIIGEKFKNNEVFVPEVLMAARALNYGLAVLEPKLLEGDIKPIGKVVIGTVKGDQHDIGKNLVAMMLKGAGFNVTDLGVDVAPDVFADKAEEIGADIICMSALLTTTMSQMQEVIGELDRRSLRDHYIVMVGGAPVTQSFAEKIGADWYTKDAATAAQTAKKIMEVEKNGNRK